MTREKLGAGVDKLPWYQWFPLDFERDEAVRMMSYEAEGMYRRLLDHAWLTGSLPADLQEICKLLPKADKRKICHIWRTQLCALFVPNDSGRLINRKLERVRAQTADYRDKQSAAGRASAEARRRKFGSAQPNNPRTDHRTDDRTTSRTDGSNTGSISARTSAERSPNPHIHSTEAAPLTGGRAVPDVAGLYQSEQAAPDAAGRGASAAHPVEAEPSEKNSDPKLTPAELRILKRAGLA